MVAKFESVEKHMENFKVNKGDSTDVIIMKMKKMADFMRMITIMEEIDKKRINLDFDYKKICKN